MTPHLKPLMSILAAGLLANPVFAAETADTIFINGKIATLDAKDAQAEGVAVKDGRLIAVGSSAEIKAYAGGSTQVFDLQRRRVLPGLIDAHAHPLETLWMMNDWVDARYPETPSVAVTLQKIAERAKASQPGEWIYVACVSASENKFEDKRLPTRAELDAVSPDNPLVLGNGTHMAIANTKALQALGIGKGTSKLPKGGGVLLDADGHPTGVITDGFADIPGSPKPDEIVAYYSQGIAAFWNQFGYTSVLAITPHPALPVLQQVSTSVQQPNIRYSVSVWSAPDGKGFPDALKSLEMPQQADPNYFRFLGIKAWIDGENDCRTGFMYEPYEGHFDIDPPGGRGTLVTPQPAANDFVDLAHRNDKLAMLHCSGDAAMDICLTAYEQSAASDPARLTPRRIEHFGMFQMNDQQLARAEALKTAGLTISIQPIWLTELVKADIENMGEDRARTGYRFRSMIAAGLEPAASTDMTGIYLGNINPFRAMAAVITRQSDSGLFEPQEAVPVEDAVRMWTIWGARAIGEGQNRGSIEVGKLADMTVLSADIYAIPAEQIAAVRAEHSIVGGRIVYSHQ